MNINIKGQLPRSLKARYDYLASIKVFDESGKDIYSVKREEWLTYVKKSVDRVFYVLSLIEAKEKTRVLEIGASPYLVTAGMVDLLGLEVTAVSGHDEIWPGTDTAPGLRQRVISVGGTSYQVDERMFNVEKDLFPIKDNEFDLVLCNEVIEHLLFNPTHMLCEIQRVLASQGKMILSTGPNMLYWRLALQLFLNMTIEMPYSGDGPYGRHNRLFTLDELVMLVEGKGFSVDMVKVQTFREVVTKSALVHLLRQATLLVDRVLARFPFQAVKKKAGENITLVCSRGVFEKPTFPPNIYHSMYPEWLNTQGIHYIPSDTLVNRWVKK